jgi:hypothetical protein
LGGKQIEAEIQEKETARETYDEALRRNETAFLIEVVAMIRQTLNG